MREVILTNVSIKDWIVNSYKYGLLDFSGKALSLLLIMLKFCSVVGWPVVV